jgi:hypothetical protein
MGNFYKYNSLQQKYTTINNSLNNNLSPLRKRNSSDNVNNYDRMIMMKKYIDVK